MRFIDITKSFRRWCDGLYIHHFGRPLLVREYVGEGEEFHSSYSPPVRLYGLYSFNQQDGQNMFGIDAPDEMQIKLNYKDTLKELCGVPSIGSRITTVDDLGNHMEWRIAYETVEDHPTFGMGRLVLTVEAYAISVTAGKTKVQEKIND